MESPRSQPHRDLPGKGIVEDTCAAYKVLARRYAETWFDDRSVVSTLERFLSLIARSGAVLDIGCGPGRDVRAMAEKGVASVGIDFCEEMLAEARRRVPTGIFRRMDMQRLAYPSAVSSNLVS
jgi:trans-aconitate methyltransferase